MVPYDSGIFVDTNTTLYAVGNEELYSKRVSICQGDEDDGSQHQEDEVASQRKLMDSSSQDSNLSATPAKLIHKVSALHSPTAIHMS